LVKKLGCLIEQSSPILKILEIPGIKKLTLNFVRVNLFLKLIKVVSNLIEVLLYYCFLRGLRQDLEFRLFPVREIQTNPPNL